MIRFTEKTDRAENLELSAANYQDIKPTINQSVEKVYSFWDNLFNGNLDLSKQEYSDDEIISEIYGRDQSEFSFDFDVQDDEIQSVLARFEDNEWIELGYEDKVEAIDDLISVIGEKLEVTDRPQLNLIEDDENVCGAYNRYDNSIDLNVANLNNPKEVVNTIAHEMRHAYQYQRACIGESYEDKMYGYNFLNYIQPEEQDGYYINFLDYQDQLIEAEARAFADLFSK